MNWYIEKECFKCFGHLRVYESNVEFRTDCMGRVEYFAICDNCNTRINVYPQEIDDDVYEYIRSNRHPQITLSVPPVIQGDDRYRMTHLSCDDRVTHSLIHANEFLVEFSWTFTGVGVYIVYYNCPECGYRINLAEIREDENNVPERYKYAIYQSYRELLHDRRRSRKRRGCLKCITLNLL